MPQIIIKSIFYSSGILSIVKHEDDFFAAEHFSSTFSRTVSQKVAHHAEEYFMHNI